MAIGRSVTSTCKLKDHLIIHRRRRSVMAVGHMIIHGLGTARGEISQISRAEASTAGL